MNKRRREIVTCSECPTQFDRYVGSPLKTCSPECSYARNLRIKRERNGGQKVTRLCEFCPESFECYETSNQKTCKNPECRAALRRQQDAARRARDATAGRGASGGKPRRPGPKMNADVQVPSAGLGVSRWMDWGSATMCPMG